MNLEQLARSNRVKRVELDVDGEKLTVTLNVPVGREALEYLRAGRDIDAKLAELLAAQARVGLTPGKVDLSDSEATAAILAKAAKRAAKSEATSQALDAIDRLGAELDDLTLQFAFDWLPRLSDDLAKLGDDGLGNVLRRTGLIDSPLVTALQDMTRVASGTEKEDDGLDDLPFPGMSHDQLQAS